MPTCSGSSQFFKGGSDQKYFSQTTLFRHFSATEFHSLHDPDSLILTKRSSRKPVAMQATSTRLPRGGAFVQGVPPALRPVLRAYVLGYASSTAPRLLTLLLTHLSRKRKNIDEKPDDFFLLSLFRILKGGLELQRFPTFCAALVGGSTLLQARDQPPFSTPANKESDTLTQTILTPDNKAITGCTTKVGIFGHLLISHWLVAKSLALWQSLVNHIRIS
jgi:hypothetical protein